jgi:adenine-specific DNA methylase
MLKKKDKEIAQKQKVEEVLNNAMKETEAIYQNYKEKLDSFEQFMQNIQKEIQSLSEENYKLKIESEQEKNLLNIRLKSELEVKSKLEEKAKNYDRIEEEAKATR